MSDSRPEEAKIAAAKILADAVLAKNLLEQQASDPITLALLRKDISYIQKDISEINTKLDNKYVTVETFEPIKRIVYGLVGLILIAVVGAILALIIKK